METKALWPTVWIVGIVMGVAAILLVFKVEIASIIALFSLVGNVITLMLYAKVQAVETKVEKVEANTNGTLSARDRQIDSLIEYAKNSTPVEKM